MQLLMTFYGFALFRYQNNTCNTIAVKYWVPCVMLGTGSPNSVLRVCNLKMTVDIKDLCGSPVIDFYLQKFPIKYVLQYLHSVYLPCLVIF